jgi:hypothetical protein
MDRDAMLDTVRRTLRADIAERIAHAGLEGDIAEQVASDLHELLDKLLVDFQLAELDRHTAPVVGAHLFGTAWPRILLHILPLAARAHDVPGRVVERLGLALAAGAVDA